MLASFTNALLRIVFGLLALLFLLGLFTVGLLALGVWALGLWLTGRKPAAAFVRWRAFAQHAPRWSAPPQVLDVQAREVPDVPEVRQEQRP